MDWVTYLLSGGFAKGYRTYILTTIAVVTLGASYAVGDLTLTQLVPAVATALGLSTVRASNTPQV